MALQSFLQISAGGEDVPVEFGEDTTQSAQGETDVSAWIECSAFEAALDAGKQGTPGSSRTAGHRVWHPARFVLRVGKSTPLLFEAMRRNQRIDLTLHLFHRHHATGEIEERFQYRISQGRITSIRLTQRDTLDPATAQRPEQVELSVVPNVVEIESLTGGTQMTDDWSARGVA